MKSEFIDSKRLVNWVGMIAILAVFALDTALGNVYKAVGSDDYVVQVYQYVSFKEVFGLVPYLLLVIISLNIRIRFDHYDMAVLYTCLILQLLNVVDFFVNNNWRPMWSDWIIFAAVTLPALIFKAITIKKI